MREGYIMVYQDVRGRWMSEGDYDNMRPHLAKKNGKTDIDESTDTYDTIDWLLKNIKNNNGKVGQYGISYPGFYTTAGAIEAHPALKASSPQAPIADFYFDDFHHQGAYLLSYFRATTVFGYQTEPTTKSWYPIVDLGTPDQYKAFLELGPLKNGDKYYGKDNFFWQQLKNHPHYDEFWQKRNILPHLKNINHAVMTVGGWFDAEDLYGPLNTYKTIEENNPKSPWNTIVMGPWSHGDWAREREKQYVGYVYFGDYLSDYFQQEVETPFFNHFLKDMPKPNLPEALLFDTGKRQWKKFAKWPAKNRQQKKLYLHKGGKLSFDAASEDGGYSEYISDPAKPVPYSEDIKAVFTPRKFMTDDQRFAGRRPDVLVFQTDVLAEDLTLGGELMARLKVSTTGTDADWVVKLIDVYPSDHEDYPDNPKHVRMGDYEMLVRSEVIRGRYRKSFSNPEPFKPNEITDVNLKLQDVLHTFKKGHRIMIQIQSTWFPYIDRNPQKYVENIFYANEEDFIKATHRVYHSSDNPTHLEVDVLK
jgi:putative CocE/NonD family hydrolase